MIGLWPTLAWFVSLLVLTALFGFIIALMLFFRKRPVRRTDHGGVDRVVAVVEPVLFLHCAAVVVR